MRARTRARPINLLGVDDVVVVVKVAGKAGVKARGGALVLGIGVAVDAVVMVAAEACVEARGGGGDLVIKVAALSRDVVEMTEAGARVGERGRSVTRRHFSEDSANPAIE